MDDISPIIVETAGVFGACEIKLRVRSDTIASATEALDEARAADWKRSWDSSWYREGSRRRRTYPGREVAGWPPRDRRRHRDFRQHPVRVPRERAGCPAKQPDRRVIARRL